MTNKPYDDDLAQIHDEGYGAFARNAAPGILKLMHQNRIHVGRVVDLGCGSGIWAKALIEAGYDVTGVDLSPSMIALARQRAPAAEYHVASFLRFEFPPCRVITALGEVVCYLFDSDNSLRNLRRVCQRAFQALEPGGLLIFDIAEPERSQGVKQVFRTAENWACLVDVERDVKKQRLTRRITSFLQRGDDYHRHEETHVLQLYCRTEVAKMLRELGFRVKMLRAYGSTPFPPALAGLLARKPS